MSGLAEQVLAIRESQGPEYGEYNFLGPLAAMMIAYDQRVYARDDLTRQRLRFAEQLAGMDETIPFPDQPDTVALNALGYYVVNKQLEEANKEVELAIGLSHMTGAEDLLGKVVRVTSTNPDRYNIGTSRRDMTGGLQGLSKYYSSRKGIVTHIDVGLKHGGWIEMSGVLGRVYTIAPLIDRLDKYKPGFTIKVDR